MNVINISLGTYKGLTNLEDRQTVEMYDRAIKFAQSKQVIIVASAGNRGQRLVDNSSTHLPGGHPEIITVGSTLRDNTVANYSNYGENLKIVAPGGYLGTEFDINKNIDVTHMLITKFPDYLEQNPIDKALNLTRGYSLNFGTSLSTPQVTGAIVRLKYDNSNLSNKTIIKKLYKNALDIESIGRDIKSGYGLLQIKR